MVAVASEAIVAEASAAALVIAAVAVSGTTVVVVEAAATVDLADMAHKTVSHNQACPMATKITGVVSEEEVAVA